MVGTYSCVGDGGAVEDNAERNFRSAERCVEWVEFQGKVMEPFSFAGVR